MNNRIRSNHVQLGKSMFLENKKIDFSLEENFSPEEKEELERKKHKIKEAQEKAAEILKSVEKAQKQAEEELKTQIQNRLADIENLKQQSIEQGYAEGFQKGYDEGINQAKQEAGDKIEAVNTISSATFRIKKEIINSAEKEIIELSTAIAEKILRQKLELSPEFMQEIIKSAIEQLQDKEDIKIIVNPSLTSILYEFAEELKDQIMGLKSIKITEDRTVPPDGVIVESRGSRIDGRLETRLAEIVKNLTSEFFEKSNSEGISEEIEAKIEETAAKEEKKKNKHK